MPTTYTHDYFGKVVYRSMPSEMKELVRQNGEIYRIGLHGPDILFYYMLSKNPVSKYGVKLHGLPAADFFEKGMEKVRKTKDPELFAYLLGFGCHYILDSTCHPYVRQLDREGRISHTLVEKEFDRFLMEKTGKNPYRYHPSDAITAKRHYAEVIHRAIPQVSAFNIWVSMRMQKRLTNLMVCDDGGRKRKLAKRILSPFGSRAEGVLDYLMTPMAPENLSEELSTLCELFDQAAREAPPALNELWELSSQDKKLSPRWMFNYSGECTV